MSPFFLIRSHQTDTNLEKGNKLIKLLLLGSVQQELWITPNPFSLTRSRLTNPSNKEQIEIVFSDFSEVTGNRTPMRCEIKDGPGEHVLPSVMKLWSRDRTFLMKYSGYLNSPIPYLPVKKKNHSLV